MERRERSGGGPRNRTKTKTTSKVTAERRAGSMAHPIAKRFSDEVEKAVAALARRMNGQIRVLGRQHEAIATDLCEGLFGDPKDAPQPVLQLADRYQAMQERAERASSSTPTSSTRTCASARSR